MRLKIDTNEITFTVTKAPIPKRDADQAQKIDKRSGEPLWVTQLLALEQDEGGEIINVTSMGKAPRIDVGDEVEFDELVAHPWVQGTRGGVAYRANGEIYRVED